MYGIDISNWQKGINLGKVSGDFVIIKATEGKSYTNPEFERQYQDAKEAGKLLGVYHYASGSGFEDELSHFLKVVKDKIGEAILCLDWEEDSNEEFNIGNEYALKWLKALYKKTGVKGLLYVNKSELQTRDYSEFNSEGFKLWGAQYPNYIDRSYEEPWVDGKPWGAYGDNVAIHQFTATGRLLNYSGYLDLNYSTLTPQAWEDIARGAESDSNGSTLQLAAEVMEGKHGDGNKRLRALGIHYEDVQGMINHIDQASKETLVKETLDGLYGDGSLRKTVLAYRYQEVQAAIDEIYSRRDSNA